MADLKAKVPGFELQVSGIKKLLDYAAAGVGAVAGPMLANWRASKEGQARLTSARYGAEVRRIEAESRGQALAIIAEAQAEARQSLDTTTVSGRGTIEITAEYITQSIEFQGRKRMANTASVVQSAADELGDKDVPDSEPDPDWTARFFDGVQDVSSKDMQMIWARILAGEVETPGRTSLRTLSMLRNMSQIDAKQFSELMRFRISDFILGKFAEQVSSKGLDALLLNAVDIGLTYSSMVAYPSIKLSTNGFYDREYYGHVLRIEGPPGTEMNAMSLDATILTPSGRELARYISHEPHIEYLSCFARHLETQKCTLKLAPIVSMSPDGRMQFSLKELRTL